MAKSRQNDRIIKIILKKIKEDSNWYLDDLISRLLKKATVMKK